jgi:type IV secretion system protein VirB10
MIQGGSGPKEEGGTDKEGKTEKRGLLGRSRQNPEDTNFALDHTNTEEVRATKMGPLYSTIGQGKVIDVVLETAINTDLPGMLRAVIARDVYAETGRNILIPKGSRLIGSYAADIRRGQRRVLIIWKRVMRPDGVDIAIDSPATDPLGRAGVAGIVDNRYMEMFGNAFLVSAVSIGVAAAAGSSTISQTTNGGNGSTTQQGTSTALAAQGAVGMIGQVAQNALGQLATQPTITVDQGTLVKVFVNHDLRFPDSIANNYSFVP